VEVEARDLGDAGVADCDLRAEGKETRSEGSGEGEGLKAGSVERENIDTVVRAGTERV
jgi:hypothetical protein